MRNLLCMFVLLALASLPFAAESETAFPGALGWAASTPGGRGGTIIRVTNLNAAGPGSFAEAIHAKGPRIVVFEAGGVIDLDRQSLGITEPYLTIAGQTAPSPGITFIRGGLRIATHDVIVQHIRVRPGEAGEAKKSGWECDAIATDGHDIIVDHCSCTWATDENLSASGPRFDGAAVGDWRQNTSHRVTFSHCIVAEGLSDSTHGKGEHSKGSLIHDNATDILIFGNLYASNRERNPLFKGGARGAIVNNFIANPEWRAMHYGLVKSEWDDHPHVAGQMTIIGNALEYGLDSASKLAIMTFHGDGPLDVFMEDNLAVDLAGNAAPLFANQSRIGASKCRMLNERPLWPEGLKPMPAKEVKDYVVANAGARPWDRDAIDSRIVRQALEGTGRVIDSEQEAGVYPAAKETRAAFNPDAWDLRSMTRKEKH